MGFAPPQGYSDRHARARIDELEKKLEELQKPKPVDVGSAIGIFDATIQHPLIRKSTERLFKTGNYSSAILEAMKAVAHLVKEKSKLTEDGQSLMSHAFAPKAPIIKLNALTNQSDLDEQAGFCLIFMGAMTGIRNPKAHTLVDQRDPVRTLHYLMLADLLAIRLEDAK